MRIHGFYPSSSVILGLLAFAGAVILVLGAFGAWIARWGRTAGWLAVLAVLLILASIGAALAQSGRHGDGHAEHHDWYQRHKQPGTSVSCCGARMVKPDGTVEGDCRPVRAFRTDDGSWHAVVDGRPFRIPRSVILNDAAPDGRAHLCMSEAGTPLCFFEPQPKS